MESKILSSQEIRRYQKLIANENINLQGQEKIKQSSVLVIGAGCLGSPVLMYLTALGVGTIGILDNDLVEEKNLPGQTLYGSKDLGKQKAIVAKQKLVNLNHNVEFKIHNICISPNNVIGFCQEYDVIVDATDNLSAKYIINDACVILKKAWVSGTVNTFEGSFAQFDGKNGPTFRCLFGEKIDRKPVDNTSQLGILPGIIGTFLANDVVQLITGYGEKGIGLVKRINLLENLLLSEKIDILPENLNIKSIS
jgi:adenylyltransferase/sulfurtransferase